MSKPNDGGPAFPCNSPDGLQGYKGMTLRQAYAMAALQGWAAGRNNSNDMEGTNSLPQFVAATCFKYADAMIEHERLEKDTVLIPPTEPIPKPEPRVEGLIKTCPFKHLNNRTTLMTVNADRRDYLINVECSECHARGPVAFSDEDAIALWNQRVFGYPISNPPGDLVP